MESKSSCGNSLPEPEYNTPGYLIHNLTQIRPDNSLYISAEFCHDGNILHVDEPRVDKYCRVCGLPADPTNLTGIFGDQGSELGLHQKILNHLKIQVQKDDQLPSHVCITCICKLNICHQLFEISQSADTKLRQLFLLPQVTEKVVNSVFKTNEEQDSIDTNIGDYETVKTNDNNNSADSEEIVKALNSQANKNGKGSVSLLCHICGKHFKSSANLQAHRRTHLDDSLKKKHQCSVCDKVFRSKFHLAEHMNIHNGVMPYACKECGKTFHQRAQLRQHSLVHADDSKKAVCEVCGLRFSRRSNLLAHAKTHMSNRTFSCRLCQAEFPSVNALLSHRSKHNQEDIRQRLSLDLIKNKEKIFTCEACGKMVTNKESLVSHHCTVAGSTAAVERHKCSDCGKVLRSERSLAYHRRSQHSGDRPFHCSTCGLGLMSRRLLQAHEHSHTGEKPFVCEICWKGFRSKNNLSQHMLKHNAQKNFECSVCGKKFFRKGALKVHNRKHTGEMPFICDLCGRPFLRKNDMLKHQKTHTQPTARTRTCDICASVFPNKKELIKHKETVHNEQQQTSVVPLIITNNLFETHIITEDGQKIVLTTLEAIDAQTIAIPSTSVVQTVDSVQ